MSLGGIVWRCLRDLFLIRPPTGYNNNVDRTRTGKNTVCDLLNLDLKNDGRMKHAF